MKQDSDAPVRGQLVGRKKRSRCQRRGAVFIRTLRRIFYVGLFLLSV